MFCCFEVDSFILNCLVTEYFWSDLVFQIKEFLESFFVNNLLLRIMSEDMSSMMIPRITSPDIKTALQLVLKQMDNAISRRAPVSLLISKFVIFS